MVFGESSVTGKSGLIRLVALGDDQPNAIKRMKFTVLKRSLPVCLIKERERRKLLT